MSALTEATREVTTLFSELMETLIKDQPEKPLDFLIDHLSSQAVSDDKLVLNNSITKCKDFIDNFS